MSYFSEMYENLTEGRKVRVYEMAEFLEIAPQTLYQILSGKRKPLDDEFCIRMASYLNLTIDERRRLLDAARRSRLGEKLYWQRRICHDFLMTSVSHHFSFDLVVPPETGQYEQEVQTLSSAASITEAIALICQEDSGKGQLSLLAPFNTSGLHMLISSLSRQKPDLKIVHAGWVPAQISDRQETEHFFGSLKSIVIHYFLSSAYSAFMLPEYYSVTQNPLSCFAVSSNGLVLFKPDLSAGLLIQDTAAANVYQLEFGRMIAGFEPCFSREYSIVKLIEYFGAIQKKIDSGIMVWNRQCCFAPLISRGMIERYLNPDIAGQPDFKALGSIENAVDFFSQYVLSEQKTWKTEKGAVYFPEAGIRHFLETGIIQEFPASCWLKMDKNDRLNLVSRLIDHLDDYPYRMMKENMGSQSDGFALFISGNTGYIQLRQADGEICILTIHSFRVISMIRDYLEAISRTRCLPASETRERLDNLLEEYTIRFLSEASD